MADKKKEYQPSKPDAIGKNMAGALKGARNDEGPVSSEYKGRPGNAIPNFNPHTSHDKPVDQWTKDSLKQAQEKAKEKRDASQKK